MNTSTKNTPPELNKSAIGVCAALIVSGHRILVAKRNVNLERGGLWEFPGGKIEPGETHEQCLIREIHEELGVQIQVLSYFADSVYQYPEKTIHLLAYLVRCDESEFQLRDHLSARWVPARGLSQMQFSPADLPIVEKLLHADPAIL